LSTDRVTAAEEKLDAALAEAQSAPHLLADDDPVRPGSTFTASMARTLFENQFASRSTDAASRRLKARGLSYYTISSAGHEQNAILGTQLRLNDPSFLHYRSGGFMMARSSQSPDIDPVLDTMLSICGSKDDPISQGRHKVWGSHPLWVPPQTSTIASHLPKAVGMAFALGRSRRLDHDPGLPDDAIVMCSFGDASANHATALSGINAARYGLRRGNPMPILFVCEDNGIGISVETPPRWITETYSGLRYLHFLDAGGEVDDVWDTVEQAIHVCRSRRVPVFLRLPTERLWGHAGSDIETAYRPAAQIREIEGRDPLILNARRLIELGAATPVQLQETVARIRRRVDEAGEKAARSGQLTSVEAIVKPLAPYDEDSTRLSARGIPDVAARKALWGDDAPEFATAPVKRTMAAHLSAGLADEMLRRPETLVFGEDVGRKGGVYYVTAGLQKRFGQGRVFDTQLDETTILGLAQGAAMLGLLPIPEIQYLAYVHNAIDQIRGEATSLQFFSSGQFQNPMVIRMAGFAYQKGFGGHFHNDNSFGGLRDIPGLLIATPSRGDEAVKLLRGCVATAAASGRVVVFLEPIALYHERDLHEKGDGGWLSDYPLPGEAILPGEIGVHAPEGDAEVLIVSYANGLRMSLQAQAILSRDHGVHAKVLDLRWLNPLPLESVRAEAEGITAVIVADECRRTGGGIAEAVVADLAESGYPGRLRSVRAADSFVPLGAAANLVLIQTSDIVAGVLAAIEQSPA
jgi:2-oxoisovalerate dehydrogenase E1 component